MISEDEIQAMLDGHRHRNANLLEHISSKGRRLDEPCSVEFAFVTKKQRDAALLARELYARGLLVLMISPGSPADDGSIKWTVEAGAQRTFAEAGSDALSEELARLASKFDARYDGWGSSI